MKIVAVTASVFEEQRDKILETGCDELVRKPIREGEIFDAIARPPEIEYLYSDVEQIHASGEASMLTVEMLSELPAVLLAELRHATLVLDRAAMADLIKRIEVHAPETAVNLQALVDGFQFERIRDLLRDLK